MIYIVNMTFVTETMKFHVFALLYGGKNGGKGGRGGLILG